MGQQSDRPSTPEKCMASRKHQERFSEPTSSAVRAARDRVLSHRFKVAATEIDPLETRLPVSCRATIDCPARYRFRCRNSRADAEQTSCVATKDRPLGVIA